MLEQTKLIRFIRQLPGCNRGPIQPPSTPLREQILRDWVSNLPVDKLAGRMRRGFRAATGPVT
jgi:hypothetical protein